MIIDGLFTIDAPVQEVWDFLVDIERMSACMPGVESVERTDENTYTGTVTVKVGPLGASFKGTVTKTVEEPPRLLQAKLQGRDQKTASMVSGEFSSELKPLDSRKTEVAYKFDVAIRGRLGQFGQAVILDTSRQLTEAFVQCVRARVERPETPAESAAPRASVTGVAFRAFLLNLRQAFVNLWARIKTIFRST